MKYLARANVYYAFYVFRSECAESHFAKISLQRRVAACYIGCCFANASHNYFQARFWIVTCLPDKHANCLFEF